MSERTQCNHCTLRDITARAAERGATVTTRMETPQERAEHNWGDAWVAVEVSDQPKPVAWFAQLTTHCVC